MGIKDYLMNRRAGRSLLAALGMGSDSQARSYFSYRVGNRSDRQQGDYFLYFRDHNVPVRAIDNFAFSEMVQFGADYAIRFLQFQLAQSEMKADFLQYLQAAIPNRQKTYKAEKYETLEYCLKWVNTQLEPLRKNNSQPDGTTQIAVFNNIALNNDIDNAATNNISLDNLHTELEVLKEELRDRLATNNGSAPTGNLKDVVSRLERVDNAIGLFEFGQIATGSATELKQVVFLLLAMQSYHLDNDARGAFFFTQLTKMDISRLLKSNFRHFNTLAFKTTEKEVNKYDDEFKVLDLDKIHRDLKRLLSNFNGK